MDHMITHVKEATSNDEAINNNHPTLLLPSALGGVFFQLIVLVFGPATLLF